MNIVTNIINQLNIIYNIKNDIKSSLENQGQNMTGVNFENYSKKIDNLTCNLMPTQFHGMNDEKAAKLPYMFNFSNCINMSNMFNQCFNLVNVLNFDTSNVTNMSNAFYKCHNLKSMVQLETINVTSMKSMFAYCNNLSNESIQNIINMCLNSNVSTDQKYLSNRAMISPLYSTKFDNSYYTNRFSELDAKGWSY